MNDRAFGQYTSVVASVEVTVQSYRVERRWASKVETREAGNVVGRALADTRENAEAVAIAKARFVMELQSAAALLRVSGQETRHVR